MDHQWIYFLKTSEKLPQNFYDMATALNKLKIDLIPVNIQDLLLLSRKESTFSLMLMIKNMAERKYFQHDIYQILSLLIKNKEVALYLFSSFSEARQLFSSHMNNRELLKFFQFPVTINEALSGIYQIEKYRFDRLITKQSMKEMVV